MTDTPTSPAGTSSTGATLADLLVAQCAEVWRDDPEWLATGITPIPRLGASLAKLTFVARRNFPQMFSEIICITLDRSEADKAPLKGR